MTFSGLGGQLGTIAAATPFAGPLAPVIGAAAGGIIDMFGGGDDGVNQTKMAQKAHKGAKSQWRYLKGVQKDTYEHDVEGLEIH
jgi:hypothetical protein